MVVDNERGMMSMELNLPSDLFTEEQFGSLTPEAGCMALRLILQ